MKIPKKKECLSILNKNKTPSKIIEHSKTVCKLAEDTAEKLIKRGIDINKELVIASALLHDVERAKESHVTEGVKLLKSMGFPAVAGVIKKHSLYKLQQKNKQPKTWEEKIVFYADKRVMGNNIVSLKKRFDALERNYDADLSKELTFTKKIEKELLAK